MADDQGTVDAVKLEKGRDDLQLSLLALSCGTPLCEAFRSRCASTEHLFLQWSCAIELRNVFCERARFSNAWIDFFGSFSIGFDEPEGGGRFGVRGDRHSSDGFVDEAFSGHDTSLCKSQGQTETMRAVEH